MEVRIGTSGWSYKHWRGVFYPENLPHAEWFGFYLGCFDTVELNASFYRLPGFGNFDTWRKNSPPGFLWSVKANRYITHIRRLRDARNSLRQFYDAVAGLREKLGVVLFQLPPSLRFDEELLAEFLNLQPEEYRVAFEFRDPSWLCERAYELLRTKNAALCISDTAGRFPYTETVTADFIYVRLHGSQVLYGSSYTEDELRTWRDKINIWQRNTFVYFDNDYQGYAVRNASRLRELLA